jgi:probable rRNA maturation factor
VTDETHSSAIPPLPPPSSAGLELVDATRTLSKAQLEWILAHAVKALRVLHTRGSVQAKIVGDAEMAQAHMEFLGVEGTTDVITFDLSDPDLPPPSPPPTSATLAARASAPAFPLDVDLLLCLDEAQRQSLARDTTPEQELLLYILHGVLHCMGHDDHDDAAFAAMHATEDAVLVAIGVGAVFGRGG